MRPDAAPVLGVADGSGLNKVIAFFLLAWLALSLGAAQSPPPDEPALERSAPQEKPHAASADQPPPTTAEPAPDAPLPPPSIPPDLQPYQVQMQVGFENDPQFNGEFRRAVLAALREGLERYVGQFWNCTIAEEQGKIFTGLPALRRLRGEALPKDAFPAEAHKVFLLSVHSEGSGYRVAGREWDVITRQLGEMAFQAVAERGEIPEALLAVVHDVFRPIAAVATPKSGGVTLRARGGEFPPPDESWLPLQNGGIFEVYYCFLNKEREIERVQQVPFTYLVVGEEAGRGIARGSVTSGLRTPLTARRRIQPLALGITRRRPETRLTLITRPPARKPLAGVEVEISPVPTLPEDAAKKVLESGAKQDGTAKDPEKEQEKPPAARQPAKLPRLVADRSGVVNLSASASPNGEPVWLFVKSGQALLARVPIVPGAQSAEVLELPDDTLRLEIEGSIATLQAELVDAVARRAVLMSQAKSRAKAGQWEAMSEILKQLDDMPKAGAFAININAIRQPALKAARARRDRTTEERIKKLCDEAAELVTNYLDEEKLKELKEELTELQQLAADEAAADAFAKGGAAKPAKPDGGTKKKTKKKTAPPPAAPAPLPQNPPQGF
jgi:hypothetical protein